MNDLSSASRWHLLGELILSIGSSPDELISLWMNELLAPLDLHESFVNRVLKSAQDYAGRALHPEVGLQFSHIHLSIFGPAGRAAGGKTWGFFRIEKIDSAEQKQVHPDHTVEFYLYQEQG